MDFRRLSGRDDGNATDENADCLSFNEKTNLKNVLPQVVASAVSALYRVGAGIFFGCLALGMSHSNSYDEVLINLFRLGDGLAAIPIGGVVCGFLIDRMGRLKTIKLAVVPAIIGCIFSTISQNFLVTMIPILFTGISLVCGSLPAIVYTTEIAHPALRGSLLSIGPFLTSLGLVISIFTTQALTLQIVIVTVCSIVASIAVHFLPESPLWLIAKNRNDQAKKSLEWLDKYQPPPTAPTTFAQLHYDRLVEEHRKLSLSEGCCLEIRKPGFYKPLLILLGLFFFQQLSGMCTVVVLYLGGAFETTKYDLLVHDFFIAFGLQAVAALVNLLLFRLFRRRTLFICGSAAMTILSVVYAIVIFVKQGPIAYWIYVVAFILGLGVWMTSVLPVPATMMAELFPDQIRGVASCMMFSLSCVTWLCSAVIVYFVVDLLYPAYIVWLFVFALTIFVATLAHACIFLPETHKVKLSDVQKYFSRNNTYITWVLERRKENRQRREEVPMNDA